MSEFKIGDKIYLKISKCKATVIKIVFDKFYDSGLYIEVLTEYNNITYTFPKNIEIDYQYYREEKIKQLLGDE